MRSWFVGFMLGLLPVMAAGGIALTCVDFAPVAVPVDAATAPVQPEHVDLLHVAAWPLPVRCHAPSPPPKEDWRWCYCQPTEPGAYRVHVRAWREDCGLISHTVALRYVRSTSDDQSLGWAEPSAFDHVCRKCGEHFESQTFTCEGTERGVQISASYESRYRHEPAVHLECAWDIDVAAMAGAAPRQRITADGWLTEVVVER
ncbi:MAG: hypothetical protein IT463_13035 [Planctomycetes bacterium]|nr:hypothetical protein [Planctomycetota bacterium]